MNTKIIKIQPAVGADYWVVRDDTGKVLEYIFDANDARVQETK